MLNFVAVARVSSREQEEGYSLEAQVKAMKEKAERAGLNIVKVYRIVESAKASEDRVEFGDVLEYVLANRRQEGGEIDGMLFHKVDRAARNLPDWSKLRELGVSIKFVNEDFPENPAGRFSFNIMASVAAFYSDNLREEVLKGMNEKAQQGWLPTHAPYGYSNARNSGGEAIIAIDSETAPRVRQLFEIYATGRYSIDSLAAELKRLGIFYTDRKPTFGRSTLHKILTNRFYVGRLRWKGVEYPGKHEPLLDRGTWDRVQAMLGGRTYKNVQLPFAGGLLTCRWCGSAVTGERKTKTTREGVKEFDYYRCSHYTDRERHPVDGKLRIAGGELEGRFLEVVEALRFEEPEVLGWLREVLAESHEQDRRFHHVQIAALQDQYQKVRNRLDGLYKELLDGAIPREDYERLRLEWTQEREEIKARLAQHERASENYIALGVKVLELCQSLPERWVKADPPSKRALLQILLLNCEFDGVTLFPTYRKPFDLLAEGLSARTGGP